MPTAVAGYLTSDLRSSHSRLRCVGPGGHSLTSWCRGLPRTALAPPPRAAWMVRPSQSRASALAPQLLTGSGECGVLGSGVRGRGGRSRGCPVENGDLRSRVAREHPARPGLGVDELKQGRRASRERKTRCQVRSVPSARPGPVPSPPAGIRPRRCPRELGASEAPLGPYGTEAQSGHLVCPVSPRRAGAVELLGGGVKGAWVRVKD